MPSDTRDKNGGINRESIDATLVGGSRAWRGG